jgi:hypothetical protein
MQDSWHHFGLADARRGAPDRSEYRQAAGVIVEMRTPDQYREFAAQCYRLAAEAKTEVHQKMMEEMARAWSEVAEQAEKREGLR